MKKLNTSWQANPWVWVIEFEQITHRDLLTNERPIIFSTPMVQAILAGRKTQTRRIISESYNGCLTGGGPHPCPNDPVVLYPGEVMEFDGYNMLINYPQVRAIFHCSTLDSEAKCPYGKPGDILWVRETHKLGAWREDNGRMAFDYKASPEITNTPWVTFDDDVNGKKFTAYWQKACDELHEKGINTIDGYYKWDAGKSPLKWRPSIHMPKCAARILLRITDIRVEPLQSITEHDAVAEGIEPDPTGHTLEIINGVEHEVMVYLNYSQVGYRYLHPIDSFRTLWDSINGDKPSNKSFYDLEKEHRNGC